MQNFEIRDDEQGLGKVLIVKNSWSDEIAEYMLENKIFALRLTDSFGFKGEDLSFVPSLTFLKSFELYCLKAKNIKVIEALPQLEVIGLQFLSQEKLDFSAFYNLRVALLTWGKGLASILNISTLEYLNIQNYPYASLREIEHMASLKKLYLTSRKLETLEGATNLKNLEILDLYNCQQLTSKEILNDCGNLKSVEIEGCNKLVK